MNLKKTLSLIIILLIFHCDECSGETEHQPIFTERHIVIIHDVSGSVTKKKLLLNRITKYLNKILFNGIKTEDVDKDDFLPSNIETPFWGNNFVLTFLTFGFEKSMFHSITQHNEELWVKEFVDKLICLYDFSFTSDINKAKIHLNKFLSESQEKSNQWTFSRYIFPFLLSKLPDDIYAKETFLIVISDYRYGQVHGNIGDRGGIKNLAGEKFLKSLEDKQSNIQNLFTLSVPVFDLNVGGTQGIAIRCMKIEVKSPLNGEFFSVPTTLRAIRKKGEILYLIPPISFEMSNSLDPLPIIKYMGLFIRQPSKNFPYFLSQNFSINSGDKKILMDCQIDQSRLSIAPALSLMGTFLLAERYDKDGIGMGLLHESSPFKISFETREPIEDKLTCKIESNSRKLQCLFEGEVDGNELKGQFQLVPTHQKQAEFQGDREKFNSFFGLSDLSVYSITNLQKIIGAIPDGNWENTQYQLYEFLQKNKVLEIGNRRITISFSLPATITTTTVQTQRVEQTATINPPITVQEEKSWFLHIIGAILSIVCLAILFGRYRKVDEIIFPQMGRETHFFLDKDCQLFQCDPKDKSCRLEVHLIRKKSILNFSNSANITLKIEGNHGGFPITNFWFEDNKKNELIINKIKKDGKKVGILFLLNGLKVEDFWKYDSRDERKPFEIRVSVDSKQRIGGSISSTPNTLFGLLVKRMGAFWLGLDPGTTGCCVFGGNTLEDIRPVPLIEEKKVIMPSIVVLTDIYDGPNDPPYNEKTIICGNPYIRNPLATFFSMKRLIGYDNTHMIRCSSGKIEPLQAEYVQSILVDYMVMKAELFFQQKPNQAVVAVPNSFTPSKIEFMKRSCLKARFLERVEHIYEIEAILLYYYKKELSREALPLTILVIDFGGSTLNVAVATLKRGDNSRNAIIVDMHCRLGFNIGGDTVTAIFADYIWKNRKEKEEFLESRESEWKREDFPSPFEVTDKISGEKKDSWEKLRTELWNYAEIKKLEISKENTAKIIGIENSGELKTILGEISKGIKEVLKLYDMPQQKKKNINYILIAGRSSLFSPFKTIIETIKTDIETIDKRQPQEILDLFKTDDERKLCVAEGAAFYGVQMKNIILTRHKTFAHYGFDKRISIKKRCFKPVIPIGIPLKGGEVFRKIEDISLEYNSQIEFFQVMAADPTESLGDKYRVSRIHCFELNQGDNHLRRAEMKLDKNDECYIKIITEHTESESGKIPFKVQDISTEMDKYTTWRLV